MQTMQVEAGKQPQNPDVRLIYAHVLSMRGDFILALEEATAAERLNPASPYVHAQRATICYHAGLTECAIHEALRFQEMPGAHASAIIIRGQARELQGHDDEAIRLDKWQAENYCELAQLYVEEGDVRKAVERLKEAKELVPGKASGNIQIGGERG